MIAESDAAGLHAIVLAAGGSTRFGSAKQLVRIGDRPLLSLVAGRAAEVVGHALIIVLGARAAELTPLLKHSPGSVVVNRDWREGLASSIRAGVARLPPSCAGVMLVLADQACVTAEDLRRLAGAWRRQPLCLTAARYGATVGVPAIFPQHLFGELSELKGDTGARALLRRHADRLVKVPMTSAAFDLDTPDDLLELNRS
ncbi:MAG: nucleotidyltransferase family protein [Gammaproteobacteria bacterium]|nr:nucleotidyltransferase family protein [Gammaproteobacteria bacterium]MDE2261952.1 nucleotidyltransferase family protein [Gammaproteobacteria bacterium]